MIETPEANLSQGMRQLNGVYTQNLNRNHNRVGLVFQERYKAILVQKDSYLLELSRYIVLNPVRAGMVGSVKDWRWSSYQTTVGLVATPDWLYVDWLLSCFAERNRAIPPAETRNEGIYSAYRSGGYSMKAISDTLGLHYSTVSKIIKFYENS